MISLGLKSTLARTLAVFSVITLGSTSFARIELKPAKQQTAEQPAEPTKVADASCGIYNIASCSGYQIVGTVVAAGVTIAAIFGLSKKCAARADDAANDAGDNGDDNNGGGGGENRWFSAKQDNNDGGLFHPFGNPANNVGNVAGNGGGDANANAGGDANAAVVKKRSGVRRSELQFLIDTSPNKK